MPGQSSLFGDAIGTTFESKRWLSLDACGIPCSLFSYALHFFALRTISSYLISHSIAAKCIWYLLYLPISILALLNLWTAQTTDPGAVPLGARPLGVSAPRCPPATKSPPTSPQERRSSDDRGNMSSSSSLKSMPSVEENQESLPLALATTPRDRQRDRRAKSRAAQRGILRCHKCGNNYKPSRAHHDSVTGRCIVKFDHYCPWVGNAVGALNHKFFVLFIFYTCLSSLLSITLLFMRFTRCSYKTYDEVDDAESASRDASFEYTHPGCDEVNAPPVIFLTIISISFTVFTCCMMCEQWDAIESNQSKIAKMKVAMGRGGTELDRVATDVNEMFGGVHPYPTWHWFFPTKVSFRSKRKLEAILGYDFRQEWLGEVYREEDHDDLEQQPQELSELGSSIFRNGLNNGSNATGDADSAEGKGNYLGGRCKPTLDDKKITQPLEIDSGNVVTSEVKDRSDTIKKRVTVSKYERQESDTSMKIV